MTNIDYRELDDDRAAVGSRSANTGRKAISVAIVGLAGSLIAYMVIKDATPPPKSLVDPTGEQFSLPPFQPATFQEPPSDQSQKLEIAPETVKAAPMAPITQVQEDLESRRRLAEEDRLRREAEQKTRDAEAARKAAEDAERQRWERLTSDQIISNDGGESSFGEDVEQRRSGERAQIDNGRETDPNRAFLNARANEGFDVSTATRNMRTDALVAQGTFIHGVLETAIQSDLPGMVRAVTSDDTYSWDGGRILIPKGTRLIGEYRSGLARGQARVFIVWTRLLRSDGVSVALGSFGTDSLGRAGLTGDVDNHFAERFGASILLSIVGGGASYLTGSGRSGPSAQTNNPDAYGRQIAAQQTSQTMTDIASEALKDSINIPPTVYIDQGTEIIVFVKRDLDFSGLYTDPVREEARRLSRGGAPQQFLDFSPIPSQYPETPPFSKQ